MADKVKGWLRKRERADGMTYLWCYQRLRPSDGKMVENSVTLGLVADIGDERAAWRRVGEVSLVEKYITETLSGKPTFGELCEAYTRDGLPFRKKDGRRKSKGTIETYQYHIKNIILPRWRDDIAGEMKPLAIRNWLYDLHCTTATITAGRRAPRQQELCRWCSTSLTTTRFIPFEIPWTRSQFRQARKSIQHCDYSHRKRSSRSWNGFPIQ